MEKLIQYNICNKIGYFKIPLCNYLRRVNFCIEFYDLLLTHRLDINVKKKSLIKLMSKCFI